MSEIVPHLLERNLEAIRPKTVRVLICQPSFSQDEWVQHHGLFFPSNAGAMCRTIRKFLSQARQMAADLVIFPELSVPAGCVEEVQAWSAQTGATVVGGSHYHETERGFVARTPIIVAGEVIFTEKAVPAPVEVSPIRGEGLIPGQEIVVLKNTPVGNLAVLICSDYLDSTLRQRILDEKIDILCVPAFQRDSSMYHSRMSNDCEENQSGIYIVYANASQEGYADGRSAIFAIVDTMFSDKLAAGGVTDLVPPRKAAEIRTDDGFLLVELELDMRRPSVPRTVHSRPNVSIIERGAQVSSEERRFVEKIAHEDERYRRVRELFVPPREYRGILEKLEQKKLVFIVGDPGIGKTYTAARILWEYFNLGYEPIWYTGLEREERLAQRRMLENFKPQNRQILYFEDPFGRTVFEKRDSIYHIFGPLVDLLAETDARVIVTSRKEIFEQFSQESLTTRQLIGFKEEMSVVKPSYSRVSLMKILHVLARSRCVWYEDRDCRSVVSKAIHHGKLSTPLAIRDLVFATESVASVWVLSARIERRQHETALSFARELQGCTPGAKLAFCLVYLFGYWYQAQLVNLFSSVVASSDIFFAEENTTFMQEIRPQLGYRIEQFGVRRTGLRFTHPLYEEAVAEIAWNDPVTQDLFDFLVRIASEENFEEVLHAIGRNVVKRADLTVRLFSHIAEFAIDNGKLRLLSVAGRRILDAYERVQDPGLIYILQRILDPKAIAEKINSETQLSTLHLAFDVLARHHKHDPTHFTALFVDAVDWQLLISKLNEQYSFRAVLQILDWASPFRAEILTSFVLSISGASLERRFSSIHPSAYRQAFEILERHGLQWIPEFLTAKFTGERDWRARVASVVAGADYPSAIVLDEKAGNLLRQHDCYNVLPVGIVDVVGVFESGEAVLIIDERGYAVGAGVAEYNSEDILRIKGRHSSTIAEVLGRFYGSAVIRKATMIPVR